MTTCVVCVLVRYLPASVTDVSEANKHELGSVILRVSVDLRDLATSLPCFGKEDVHFEEYSLTAQMDKAAGRIAVLQQQFGVEVWMLCLWRCCVLLNHSSFRMVA